MDTSIGYALGIGSGIDIKKLVTDLSAAAKAPKENLIKSREELNAARVSKLAEVSEAIDSFASALTSLVSGGSLFSQPSISDTSIFTGSATAGSRLGGLAASVEVRQLAQAQTVSSVVLPSRTDPVGQGDLTLTTSAGSFVVTVGAANDNLDGLAEAINAAGAGVTASILTDPAGARLVIKGATGAAQAFTLSVPVGTTSGLERFAYGSGAPTDMTRNLEALDAIVRVDGVEVNRASNSFSDLIEGVKIDLKRAAPGTIVSVGVTRPTATIEQTVQDFTAAYNELQALIAEATAPGAAGAVGPLRGDLAVRELQRQLGKLPSAILSSQGTGPQTLAELGVRTNRDGTLTVDTFRLKDILAKDPDGVEAMFNPTQYTDNALITVGSLIGKVKPGVYTVTNILPDSGTGATGKIDGLDFISSGPDLVAPPSHPAVGLILNVGGAVASATVTIDPGLGGALQSLRDSLRAPAGAFASAKDRLAAEAKKLADERSAMETRAEKYYNQLLTTFSSMERQVSAFKATQSYLDQQIQMWTNDRG